jgi:hypothetical protein
VTLLIRGQSSGSVQFYGAHLVLVGTDLQAPDGATPPPALLVKASTGAVSLRSVTTSAISAPGYSALAVDVVGTSGVRLTITTVTSAVDIFTNGVDDGYAVRLEGDCYLQCGDIRSPYSRPLCVRGSGRKTLEARAIDGYRAMQLAGDAGSICHIRCPAIGGAVVPSEPVGQQAVVVVNGSTGEFIFEDSTLSSLSNLGIPCFHCASNAAITLRNTVLRLHPNATACFTNYAGTCRVETPSTSTAPVPSSVVQRVRMLAVSNEV